MQQSLPKTDKLSLLTGSIGNKVNETENLLQERANLMEPKFESAERRGLTCGKALGGVEAFPRTPVKEVQKRTHAASISRRPNAMVGRRSSRLPANAYHHHRYKPAPALLCTHLLRLQLRIPYRSVRTILETSIPWYINQGRV